MQHGVSVVTYPNIMQGTASDPGLKPLYSLQPRLPTGCRFSLVTTVTSLTYKRHIIIYTVHKHRRSANLLNNLSHSMLVSAAQN